MRPEPGEAHQIPPWQLPGPDFHGQVATSLRTARSSATSQRHLPLCWARERSGLSAGILYEMPMVASAAGIGGVVALVTAHHCQRIAEFALGTRRTRGASGSYQD
jgi:hypothetical protein